MEERWSCDRELGYDWRGRGLQARDRGPGLPPGVSNRIETENE